MGTRKLEQYPPRQAGRSCCCLITVPTFSQGRGGGDANYAVWYTLDSVRVFLLSPISPETSARLRADTAFNFGVCMYVAEYRLGPIAAFCLSSFNGPDCCHRTYKS